MRRAPMTKEDAIKWECLVCYHCKEDDCAHCIGVPCMCPCPIPEPEPEEPEYSI